MEKTCETCESEFDIPEEDQDLYKRLHMESPTECIKCRTQRLFAFWPFGKFRKGKSDLSGNSLITILPENARYPIYTTSEWFSDSWEAPSLDYDPSRPFLEQFKELQEKAPRPHQSGTGNTDSEWCDDVWHSKNCYLCRSLVECENCSYLYRTLGVKDSIDLTYCYDSTKCYDLTYCFNCFKTSYSFNSRDAIESMFLYDCRNVQNCFMCWNLRGKKYYIRNKPYSKEDYFKEIEKYDLGSREVIEELRQEMEEHIANDAFHRENFNVQAVNSSGNYLVNCNNCRDCFYLEDSEDCYHAMRGGKNKSSIDMVSCLESELVGNSVATQPGYDIKYSAWVTNCRYSEYLDNCVDCEYCFGCVGLRKKKYCILNKQYSEEEYNDLKGKIIEDMKQRGEYGKFFPYDMALGGYNRSTAQMYFEKTKSEVMELGGLWEETGDDAQGMDTKELPDNIDDVDDSITTQALICPVTGYRFNIAPRELSFYKELNIPLPTKHWDARIAERFKLIASFEKYTSSCAKCDKDIVHYYPPELEYKNIYCEACYKEAVI